MFRSLIIQGLLILTACGVLNCEDYYRDGDFVKTNLRLETVPQLPTDARFIHLDDNAIKSLKIESFQGLTNCTKLFMSNNNIDSIEAGTFKDMVSLTILGLGQNQLRSLSPDLLMGLVSLQILRLNDNQISSVSEDTFSGHDKLVEVDLSGNKLTGLELGLFKETPSLQKIHLQKNLLKALNSQVFVWLKRPLSLAVSDSRVDKTQDNPLQCDCRLCWLRLEDVGGSVRWLQWLGNNYKPRCSDGVVWDQWNCSSDCPAGKPKESSGTTMIIAICVGVLVFAFIVAALVYVVYRRYGCFLIRDNNNRVGGSLGDEKREPIPNKENPQVRLEDQISAAEGNNENRDNKYVELIPEKPYDNVSEAYEEPRQNNGQLNNYNQGFEYELGHKEYAEIP